MATVTAILPIYNVEQYLVRCLDSVIGQTVQFDKIILVNDGSTDGCRGICETYEKQYDSIQLINKENGGLVSAWMEGLKHVVTSYICFIDSDDYVSPDYLETLLDNLDTDIDMVCMNATQSFDTGEQRVLHINGLNAGIYEVDDSFKSRMITDKGAFVKPVAACRWAKLLRTDLVLEYAKYCTERISYGEDQQLTLGILLGCKKIRIIDEYKYYYQYNNTSIVHTYKKDLWTKIGLLMETISKISGMQEIPGFQKQFNTQYLLYLSECLRNESYNRSLTKAIYIRMLSSGSIQDALNNYYDEKMRKIDKVIVNNAKKQRFLITYLSLELYKLIYKLRRIPG